MIEYIRFKGSNPFGSQSKMLYHLDRLCEYKFKGDTYPVLMEVNLTSNCQLNCKWCISSNFERNGDILKTRPFLKFLRDFHKFGGKAITFSGGGEPTCHPDFPFISKKAYDIGLELGLMTNGVYSSYYTETIGNYFKWVRFSLDTVNHKKYKEWKGIDVLDKVLSNIKRLEKYKVKVGINCNVYKDLTLKDTKDLIDLFTNNIKVSYIQFRPILPRYFLGEKPYLNQKIWKYLIKYSNSHKDFIYLSQDKYEDIYYDDAFSFSSCEGHYFEPVLNSNGDLMVCMHHPSDDRFVFGNIYQNSFEEIWNSKKRKKVIMFLKTFDYKNNCQMCCKLAEVNKFLDFINHPEKGVDINFL